MIEIRNISTEPLEVITHLASHEAVPAVRLDPGHSVQYFGYEPGTHIEVRPVFDAAQPRSTKTEVREG